MSHKSEQLYVKILGFRNMQKKLEKYIVMSPPRFILTFSFMCINLWAEKLKLYTSFFKLRMKVCTVVIKAWRYDEEEKVLQKMPIHL